MGLIRVNPDNLQEAANEIERVADGFRGLAEQARRATQGAPSYDGQFGPQVRIVGDEAHDRLMGLAGRLAEFSHDLVRIAEAFGAADAAGLAGMLALGSSIHSLYGANLNGLLLSLLRPSHISEAVWKALPLEDRLAILEELGLYSSLGAGPAAGTVLNVLNPLRVRRKPGPNGEIWAYATPGSEVTYNGRSQTIDGVEWYQVKYDDPLQGLITGWVCSYYLSTGRSRAGFDPKEVPQLFDIQTNYEIQDNGGRLMSVTSVEYLQIRDGPTSDYAVVDAPQWGRVVRWTGDYIEQDGHTWYEVTHWLENDDGSLEAVTGWARADRVEEYAPPPNAGQPDEGSILVPLKEPRTFSYYTVTDVDAFADLSHAVEGFDSLEPIRWTHNLGPELEVPHGALFGAEGVAMQGSGRVTLASGEVLDFELDNGTELDWANSQGELTEWGEGGWSNGEPLQIGNPEDAEFRPVSKAQDLVSGVSLAGPPELRGQWIYVEELKEFSVNGDGMFKVEDGGGAFGPGELRFDVFFADPEEGAAFYRNTYDFRLHGGSVVHVQQTIPPAIDQVAGP
jgi:hypothetical protein